VNKKLDMWCGGDFYLAWRDDQSPLPYRPWTVQTSNK